MWVGSVAVAPRVSCSGHVGSSQTTHQTRVPCIARWILNHWLTREAPKMDFLSPLILQKTEGQWLYFFSLKCFANTHSKEMFLGVNEIWKIRQRCQKQRTTWSTHLGFATRVPRWVLQFVVMVDWARHGRTYWGNMRKWEAAGLIHTWFHSVCV